LLHGSDAGDSVNRVVAQLSAFQDGLEAIREVLESGVGPSDQGPLTTQIAFSEESLSQMERLLKEMKTDTAGHPADVYLKIMKKQFKIMKSWTEPLLKGMHSQSADMSKLTQSLRQMKSDFQGVAGQVNEDRKPSPATKPLLKSTPMTTASTTNGEFSGTIKINCARR